MGKDESSTRGIGARVSHRVSHFGVYFLIFFNVFSLFSEARAKKEEPLKRFQIALFGGSSFNETRGNRTHDNLIKSHELFAVFSRLSREGNTAGNTPFSAPEKNCLT